MPITKKGRTANPEVWFSPAEVQVLSFTYRFGSLPYRTLRLELNHLGLNVDEAEIKEIEDGLKTYFNRPIVGCAQRAKELGII